MRNGKVNRKSIDLYTVYKISGLNGDNLVNILKNKGIILYNIKKKDAKTLFISINYVDNEKFFAITRDLCYNIKRVGERGKFRHFALLCRNFGIIVGALFFSLVSVISDNLVFSVEYRGSGSVYARELTEYLSSQGIGKFSRFSEIDLPALSDKILSATDKISFAECAKNGNRLIIYTALSPEPVKPLDTDKEFLISDVDGVIEQIKVYRGTALKKAGDSVKKGEKICEGYALIKDTVVKVGVIAAVYVKVDYVYVYNSENDGEENFASVFAENSLGDCEIAGETVDKTLLQNGTYEYTVKITYRKILN